MDFRFFQINRMIMHKIVGKTTVEDAKAIHRHKLLAATPEVVTLLKIRLIDACGKQSNSFVSEIDDVTKFFSAVQTMEGCGDNEFVGVSQHLADRLAHCQTSRNMKSGTLLVLDGVNTSTNKHFGIVIKAEFDNVMNTVEEGDDVQIQILEEVFLSKNQKLFKIGILYANDDVNTASDFPNSHYSTIVFDENIKASGPAEYFYRDFLGFKTESNSKIRTQVFYDKSLEFIKAKIHDPEQRCEAVNKLVSFLKNEQSGVVLNEYKNNFLPENLRDEYELEVQSKFPHAFPKDNELIKTRLKNRKVTFSGGVYLYAPLDTFFKNIKFVNSEEELQALEIEPQNTIVQIFGKPYSNE